MEIRTALNEILVGLFRDISSIEEKAIKRGEHADLSLNDMHVIEAIDTGEAKNMSSVAKSLQVTTGTLTISVNGLVKKGYVQRIRSELDRRVVLVSLTEKGRKAHARHQAFHRQMVGAVLQGLNQTEQTILARALENLYGYFRTW